VLFQTSAQGGPGLLLGAPKKHFWLYDLGGLSILVRPPSGHFHEQHFCSGGCNANSILTSHVAALVSRGHVKIAELITVISTELFFQAELRVFKGTSASPSALVEPVSAVLRNTR
jgi:hypothetical protein